MEVHSLTLGPFRPLRLIRDIQEGEQQAGVLEKYCDVVLDRMIPALRLSPDEEVALINIDLRFDEIIKSKTSLQCSEYGIELGKRMPSVGTDALSYATMEMGQFKHHLFGFAFVGLFHLFERQLGTVAHWFHYRNHGIEWGPTWKRKGQVRFEDLMGIMKWGGVPIDDQTRREIERLNLISNTVKHVGRSLKRIRDDHPDLLVWYPGQPLSPNDLKLTEDVFRGFVATLAGFWRGFPHE
jgi:hypothetical protein